jgi:hypothetical protein
MATEFSRHCRENWMSGTSRHLNAKILWEKMIRCRCYERYERKHEYYSINSTILDFKCEEYGNRIFSTLSRKLDERYAKAFECDNSLGENDNMSLL